MTTGIEWTDETWNPIRGCSRVSEGCRHCYAETMAGRFAGPGQPYEGLVKRVGGESRWTGEVRFIEKHLTDPLRWRTPRRVFVNSMSDLFHEQVTDEQLDRIFAVMALAPQHTFQVLTKRPGRMRDYMVALRDGRRSLCAAATNIRGSFVGGLVVGAAHGALARNEDGTPNPNRHPPYRPWPFLWLGVSAENQATADERIPLLMETPAAVRFISAEPLLGPLDLTGYDDGSWWTENGESTDSRLDWVIVGGESGPEARPCEVSWIRSVVEQCQWANVPVFVKQLGAIPLEVPPGKRAPFEPEGMLWRKLLRDRKGGDPSEWPEDLRVREMPRAYQRPA